MSTIGAIDCGTNSIRLLITSQGDEIDRQTTIVRLGEGVDDTGILAASALERTEQALTRYASVMKKVGVDKIRMVATSATRDAKNKDDFFAMTSRVLSQVVPGSVAEVISGEEEAQLTFRGALIDLDKNSDSLVIDLGGGSTEFAVGSQQLRQAISVNMGCVRLKERFFSHDPGTDAERSAAAGLIRENLDHVFTTVDTKNISRVVGVAGTFTTLAAVALGLTHYDSERIHLQGFTIDQVQELTDRFARFSRSEITDLKVVSAGRVDVFPVGCFIISHIVDYLRHYTHVQEITISETDILDGIAASIS